MSEEVGAINAYTCADCGGRIVTVNAVEGTTPMFLTCRSTPGCDGMSASSMYRVPPGAVPDHEWYRPVGAELRRLSPAMKDHVRLGGLDIRKLVAHADPPGEGLGGKGEV